MDSQKHYDELVENGAFIVVSYEELQLLRDHTAFAVYVALRSFANWWTGERCYPSAEQVMKRANVKSRTTLFRKLKLLEKWGFIERIGRAREGGKQTSNLYRFPFFPHIKDKVLGVSPNGTATVSPNDTVGIAASGTVGVSPNGTRTTDILTTDKERQTTNNIKREKVRENIDLEMLQAATEKLRIDITDDDYSFLDFTPEEIEENKRKIAALVADNHRRVAGDAPSL